VCVVMSKSPVTIRVRGRFTLTDASGADLTPSRRKERGLLALLALAPERRRPRSWIMDKLWSTRSQNQASGSLRRALSNLRHDLGPTAEVLMADRHDIWLTNAVTIDRRSDLGRGAEFLEGLDVPDPEFEDWLRDIRQAHRQEGEVQTLCGPASVLKSSGGTVVVLCPPERVSSPDETFLVSFLLDNISARLTGLGGAEVHVGAQPSVDRLTRADTIFWIEISSATAENDWHVRLRLHADRNRRFLWSGGTTLPMDIREICEGPKVAAFVSTALAGMFGRSGLVRRADRSAYIQLQRAAARLFTGSQQDLESAETDLARLSDSDSAVAALAWRAFACLTRVLEFREDADSALAEARTYLCDALALDPGNPLALSVAASLELKLGVDKDLGHYLAQRALQQGEHDPYALDAMAQAEKLRGNATTAYQLATQGREAAKGLPNAFFWDMEVCLTALGTNDLDTALDAARSAHLKNPSYRPALRYLCALNLLRDDHEAARRAGTKLKAIEPSFELSAIRDRDYPIHTLRQSGRLSDLPSGVSL
jgi:hypothetical protein